MPFPSTICRILDGPFAGQQAYMAEPTAWLNVEGVLTIDGPVYSVLHRMAALEAGVWTYRVCSAMPLSRTLH